MSFQSLDLSMAALKRSLGQEADQQRLHGRFLQAGAGRFSSMALSGGHFALFALLAASPSVMQSPPSLEDPDSSRSAYWFATLSNYFVCLSIIFTIWQASLYPPFSGMAEGIIQIIVEALGSDTVQAGAVDPAVSKLTLKQASLSTCSVRLIAGSIANVLPPSATFPYFEGHRLHV